MLLVGLTGNIAAGKSAAAAAFAVRGAVVIDSDIAARQAVAPGTPALDAIIRHFGLSIRQPDGSLDRAALGAIVFRDPTARRALERIVHPAVETVRQQAVHRARVEGRAVVICDIPLLFEARLAWQFPRIVLVDAPADVRIARMVRDRDMTHADATARVRSQLPASLKRGRADIVIENDGDRTTLQGRLDDAWSELGRWLPVAGSDRAA